MVLRTYFKAFWVVSSQKKFFINFSFFKFFCISGVMEFLKNHSVLFWELRAWNSSETLQMVLRTYFKAFQVVWSKKKILHKFLIFWVFLHIRGHEIFEKSLSSFFRVTGLKFIGNFKNGVADVFQSFLGCFKQKKILYKFLIYEFFCISGVMEFLKNHSVLFWELRAWNSSETLQMVLRMYFKAFQVVWSKKKFCINFLFFEFFCISGVMKFLKNH